MRNIAIIALLLVCVSLVDSAENMKEFDLMEQENMNMKDKAEIYLAGGCFRSDGVWSSDFDRAQLMNSVEYDAYNEGVYTDWLDEISRTGFGLKYDVSVSGRSKIVNYYISGDYTRQKGIRKGDD